MNSQIDNNNLYYPFFCVCIMLKLVDENTISQSSTLFLIIDISGSSMMVIHIHAPLELTSHYKSQSSGGQLITLLVRQISNRGYEKSQLPSNYNWIKM